VPRSAQPSPERELRSTACEEGTPPFSVQTPNLAEPLETPKMNKRIRAFLAVGVLTTACSTWGCVADRPSRNGVFNENQYIRKDFLIRSGNGGTDPGWFMKATIVSTSAPNPFMAPGGPLFNGSESAVYAGHNKGVMPFVRWVITSDKLQVVNMREISGPTLSPPSQGTREPEVLNAWPITNVDLKYEINLDGEITNFFSENQEADWQQRQWVKVNFDKNDMSDIAPLGENVVAFLERCGDTNVSTTLVPGSFLVDETNNYLTWQVQMTVPVSFSDQGCVSYYGSVGDEFLSFGRQDVTMTMMYSFVRADTYSGRWDATPAPEGRGCTQDGTTGALSCPESSNNYVPWVMDEKDPIQRKYGMFHAVSMDRDPNTDLLTAQAYTQRLNPNQTYPYTLYLAGGYPQEYEVIFCGYEPDGYTPATGGPGGKYNKDCGAKHTGGVVDQMNQIWESTGAKLRMRVMHNDDLTTFGDHANPNPKVFGDVRYNFIRYLTDIDESSGFLGVTEPLSDPRTGEMLTATINIDNMNLQDFYATRLEFYLESIGGQGANQVDNPYGINTKTGNWAYTPSGSCTPGDLIPLSQTLGPDNSKGGAVQTGQNAMSTVFQKMQQYLHYPIPTYGYLGPDDFIPQEDSDFYAAYNRVIPYQMYRDPSTNDFVIPEGGTGNYGPDQASALMGAITSMGQFNNLMGAVDHGQAPLLDSSGSIVGTFDPTGTAGPSQAAQFTQQWQTLSQGYTNARWALAGQRTGVKADMAEDILPYFNNFEHAGRHCVQNTLGLVPNSTEPHWETLNEWVYDLTLSSWSYTIWHEFGHSMGLDHNFMGSADRNNYPHWTDAHGNDQVGAYLSSIMEYPTTAGDLFLKGGAASSTSPGARPILDAAWSGRPGWLPYDVAALSFIYANAQTKDTAHPVGAPCTSKPNCSVSGQVSPTQPWNDKAGFDLTGKVENPFLWCTDEFNRYSPFCQQFDFGTTPSEIIASALNEEEWQYKWNNFRLYQKYWNDSGYAGSRAYFYHDILRFLSSWTFDWNPAELPGEFIKLGVTPPAGVPEQTYYTNLLYEFTNDMSVANQLVAAFHHAMVEQASGERPYITEFDPFYGDVIQQGIIIDKNYAVMNFTTLYPVDNFDPTQAAGAYLTASMGLDSNYMSIAQSTVNDFVGGQFAAFLYDSPLAAQNFAQMTQDPYFPQSGGEASIRDWIGGRVFGGEGVDWNAQYLGWAASLAAQWGFGCDADGQNCGYGGPNVCQSFSPQTCTWDPRMKQINTEDVYHSDAFNEFRGPDNRRYAWCPITDRNQALLVDRDWNTATYILVRQWNTDVTYAEDDGSGGNAAYQKELPLKYYINSYWAYN
jgi:hypothetical protein